MFTASHGMLAFVFGFFHSAQCFGSLSILLCVLLVCIYLWLNYISLHEYTIIDPFSCWWIIGLIPGFSIMNKLQWIFMYQLIEHEIHGHTIHFPWEFYGKVMCKLIKKVSKLFSKVGILFYIPTSNVWESQLITSLLTIGIS